MQVHAGALAPVQDALAAKARVATEHDANVRPDLAQPLDQQFQDGSRMARPVDVAGPQVSAQQLLAAEHVQRQVAVAVVVAMEEAPLLLAVQWVVGGVEVQHQLLGRRVKAGDELLHQHFVQSPGRGAVGPLLQPAQRGGACDLTVHAHCRLQGHVLAQCIVIVQVFPAQCQPIYPLAQQVAHAVCDQQWAARISDAARCRIHQAQLAVHLAEQHHATIAGHAAPVESTFDHTSAQVAEIHGLGIKLFCTVWHWRSQL